MANHYSGKRVAGRKPVGKRALSLLMALVMSLSLVQITAFAANDTQSERIVKQGGRVTSEDGLATVEKHVEYVKDDNFEITLTVTVRDGEETSITNKSAHVVLVMDHSDSMKTGTRFDDAKAAADKFAETLLKEGSGNEIAVVGFSTEADKNAALKSDLAAVKRDIENATMAYKAMEANTGGTNIQAGIHEAQAILAADTSNAAKIILVFSDGEPTHSFRARTTAKVTECTMKDDRPGWDNDHPNWDNDYPDWGNNDQPWDGHKGGGGGKPPKQDDEHVVKTYTIDEGGWWFDYNDIVGAGYQYDYRTGQDYNADHPYAAYTCDEHKISGRIYTDHYTNNGDPTIAEAGFAKAAGTEIYSVYLGNEDNDKAIYTMNGIASEAKTDHFLSTADTSKLAELFGQIVNKIILDTQAMTVTDPMGEYITLGDVKELAEAGLITLDKDGKGFTWNVSKSDVKTNADGSRTYTLTYPITLETSKAGFVDGNPYDTNGTTTLNYTVTKNGVKENKTTDFVVPQVNGTKPSEPEEYSYTVNYFLKTADTYSDTATYTKSFTQETFGKITIAALYNAGFENVPDGYVLDNAMLTQGGVQPGENDFNADKQVFNLYYLPQAPEQVTVTVNHHYTLTTIDKSGASSTVTDDVNGKPEAQDIGTAFTAEPVLDGYTLDKDKTTVTEGIQYTAAENGTVNGTASKNVVVDFYYSKTTDNSQPTELIVEHVYVTKNWDGSVKSTENGTTVTVKGYVDQVKNATTVPNGFKLVKAVLKQGSVSVELPLTDKADYLVTLVAGENKVTFTYEKTLDNKPINPPVGPTVTYYSVTVNYYDKASGETIHTPYTDSKASGSSYDVTAQDKIAIEGYTYVETSGDDLTGTLNGNKVINVYYTKDSNIDDGNTPTDPGTDIGDDDVPVSPAQPPKTGDSMGLWIAAAMVSGMGLVWISLSGKKREEEV